MDWNKSFDKNPPKWHSANCWRSRSSNGDFHLPAGSNSFRILLPATTSIIFSYGSGLTIRFYVPCGRFQRRFRIRMNRAERFPSSDTGFAVKGPASDTSSVKFRIIYPQFQPGQPIRRPGKAPRPRSKDIRPRIRSGCDRPSGVRTDSPLRNSEPCSSGGNYGFRRFGELRMIRITSFLSGRPLGYLTTRLSPTSIKEMEYIRPNLGYLN